MNRLCENCRYWNINPLDGSAGLCRRRAPVPVRQTDGAGTTRIVTVWPETAPLDSCGEFSPHRPGEERR